ncbi:MAG: T9SS type A sorting domain-containing protein, partial [Flavobacteriales bacterium]|nr:T9SS type A sorting domain-containing protein [Flavobacteriales bacterium]
SYTVEESGNAYLGGVKVDMGLPEVEQECKVPRVLHVKLVEIVSGQSGIIDPNSGILNFTSKEDSLIDFADLNNINYLVLFGANQIFRPANVNTTLGNSYKGYLNTFISKCHLKGIKCGIVSGYLEATYDTMREYNVSVNAGKYNYKSNGKITYFMVEYEFWNAHLADYAPPSSGLPGSMNQHFVTVYNRHKNILKLLRNQKYRDANIQGIHDYIANPYFYWSGAGNSYSSSNTSFSESIMEELDSLSDAMFLVYYKSYQAFPNHQGLEFLTSTSNFWNQRVSYLGKKSSKSVIIPLFSAEVDDSDPEKHCGGGEDFLGKYLDGDPYNSGTYIGHDFYSVEDTLLDQHAIIYNNTSTYPNIANVEIGAFAWFKYECVKKKNFSRKDLNNCSAFTTPLETINLDKTNLEMIVFPIPASDLITVKIPMSTNLEVNIFDLQGKLMLRDKGNAKLEIDTYNLNSGIYLLKAEFKDVTTYRKIIITK